MCGMYSNDDLLYVGISTKLQARDRREFGMVTVETAISLVGVMFLLVGMLGIISGGITHMQVCEAARNGARLAAMGDSSRSVMLEIEKVAGKQAHSSTVKQGSMVTVTVSKPYVWEVLGVASASATAVAEE